MSPLLLLRVVLIGSGGDVEPEAQNTYCLCELHSSNGIPPVYVGRKGHLSEVVGGLVLLSWVRYAPPEYPVGRCRSRRPFLSQWVCDGPLAISGGLSSKAISSQELRLRKESPSRSRTKNSLSVTIGRDWPDAYIQNRG